MSVFRTMSLALTIAIQLTLLAGGGRASEHTDNCRLSSDSQTGTERRVLRLLEPLTNKNFSVVSMDKKYTYLFQVCGDAGGVKYAGVVQREEKGKDVLIGSYNVSQAFGGSDWVMLIYGGGDNYDSHCEREQRRAIIMISCNRDVAEGELSVVMEDNSRLKECFYLFELDSSAVCPALPAAKLSAGSILLIVGFTLLAVYLIGGFLYQRLVVGAKGVEQFPNYAFWSEFGNLTADGCDFVCRSRGNREEPPTYRGAATEPLGEEPEERDDHLLPM